jgi:CheY-like chemotaxis protein
MEPSPPAGHVLVVDDDALFCRALKRMLHGLDVHVAQHAQAALDLLGQGRVFDLILCDVKMPGMGGAEFRKRLQAHHPAALAHLVFMTGGASNVATHQFLQGVDQPRMEKPFLRDDVLALLKRG